MQGSGLWRSRPGCGKLFACCGEAVGNLLKGKLFSAVEWALRGRANFGLTVENFRIFGASSGIFGRRSDVIDGIWMEMFHVEQKER